MTDLHISYKKGIVHITFPNQYELCATMLRMQEFYESPYPQIKGHPFTLEVFMDLYAEDKGNFTYYSDWNGFNVPGDVVCQFLTDMEHIGYPLSKKERRLVHLLKVAMDGFEPDTDDTFYLIATHKKESSPIEHEEAHAYYYLYSKYRTATNIMYDRSKIEFPEYIQSIRDTLLRMGYCEDVIIDETQAYLSTDTIDEMTKRFNCDRKVMTKLSKPYKVTLKKHIKDIKNERK